MSQTKIKLFFAYSSITNSGFILLCFILSTFESISAGFLYLFVYLISTFSLFYMFIIIKYKQKNSFTLIEFKDFISLKKINPFFTFIIAINFFSLAGIPPLTGFLSKFYIFFNLIESNNISLFLFLILISLIVAYYYIRPIKIIFFTKESFHFYNEIPFFGALIIILNFYFSLFLLVQPRLILFFIENSLLDIFF